MQATPTDRMNTQAAQSHAFRRPLALGLFRPSRTIGISVRLGELAQFMLSRWTVPPLPPKPAAAFRYVTLAARSHWLMLRESLLSLYDSWQRLPPLTVVSDGSWTSEEFLPVFGWWPCPITLVHAEELSRMAQAAGEAEVAEFARMNHYGVKLAAIVLFGRQQPILFADSDILWFDDPQERLGPPDSWKMPKGIRESHCSQVRELAERYCEEVLEPPYVNSGLVALNGELLAPPILRAMVAAALENKGIFCEQTIVSTGVKRGGGLLPADLCLVAFDDFERFRQRDMLSEGYCSRHYVNWIRHLLYRDALTLRLRRLRRRTAVRQAITRED